MTSIAIYGRKFNSEHYDAIRYFFQLLNVRDVNYHIYKPFHDYLLENKVIELSCGTFLKETFDVSAYKLMFSIGGDGTMLDSTTFIKNSGLPILGINTGRLGFLSSIPLDQIDEALEQVLSGAYMIDKRTVLKIETDKKLFGDENFALNELTIHKKDAQSMIVIHAYVDGKFLNTYWADGLIVATPTGSTAYSLSCGGPIILPSSSNFILTPVAPHNLNVRPVLISDQSVITLRVEGRSDTFLVSADSRSDSIGAETVITVMKNNFEVHLIRLKSHSFLKTMRKKLHWGLDERN